MKTTRDAMIARRPGSVTSYLTASATIAATQVEARNGIRVSTVRRPSPRRRRAPTSAPSTAAHATSRAAGWRISATPTVRIGTRRRSTRHRTGCPSVGSRRAARCRRSVRPPPAPRGSRARGLPRSDRGGRMPESRAVGSIVAAFPWPSVSRTNVGKALNRASRSWYDRAINPSRVSTASTVSPMALSAEPSVARNSRRSSSSC